MKGQKTGDRSKSTPNKDHGRSEGSFARTWWTIPPIKQSCVSVFYRGKSRFGIRSQSQPLGSTIAFWRSTARDRVPGSWRITSSLRTTRCLTGAVDCRVDVDVRLCVCAEPPCVGVPRRFKENLVRHGNRRLSWRLRHNLCHTSKSKVAGSCLA